MSERKNKKKNKIKKRPKEKLYESVRMLVIGKSNCGKTYNLDRCLKLCKKPQCIIISSNTGIEQKDLYETLIKEVFGKVNYDGCREGIFLQFMPGILSSEVLNLNDEKNELKERDGTIIIIDDPCLKELDKLSDFYLRGRHYNLSIICLFQDYFRLPVQIRRNLSHLFIYRMTGNLNPLFQDICNYFEYSKKRFDNYMTMLNMKENEYGCIMINFDAFDNNIINLIH